MRYALGIGIVVAIGSCGVSTAEDTTDPSIQKAIAALKELGGAYSESVVAVQLIDRPQLSSEDLWKLAPLVYHLKSLSFRGSAVSDRTLRDIYFFSELTELDLANTQVTDGCFPHLTPLKFLRSLSFYGTAVTGVGLYELRDLTNLTSLNLSETKIGREGLKQLRVLSALKRLNLFNTSVDNGGVMALNALQNLEELGLGGTKIDGDAGLNTTVNGLRNRGLQRLQSLYVNHTQVDDQLMGELPILPALETLRIDRTRISPVGVARLVEFGEQGYLKNLRNLVINPEQLAAGTKEALAETLPNLSIRLREDE